MIGPNPIEIFDNTKQPKDANKKSLKERSVKDWRDSGFDVHLSRNINNKQVTASQITTEITQVVTTGAVTSVNGQTGPVTLTTSHISEGSNQYFTTERAQDAVGSALTDSGRIDFTYDDGANTITADIINASVTFAKMQDVSTARLLGRSTAGTGSIEQITIGTGLSLAAGVLSSTVSGYTDEEAQDAIGGILVDSSTIDFTYSDATPSITAAVIDASITYAKIQNVTTNRLLGRSTAGSGVVEELTIGTGLSLSGGALSSTITQYTDEMAQDTIGGMLVDSSRIDFTYDDGANTITADIIDASVTYAKVQNVTTNRLLGRSTAGSGVVEELTIGTGLSLSGGTLSSTITQYTDEMAQDSVGGILTDSTTVDFTYDDGANTITAIVIDDSITFSKIQNIATARLLGRSTGGSGDVEELTIGTGLDLTAGVLSTTVTQYTDELAQDAVGGALTDSSTVDFTYDDGANTITAIVIDDSITFAKVQNIATSRLLGRSTAGSGDVEELTIGSGLDLTAGVLSSTITQYTDELAQDAIGGILTDSSIIDFTYDDGTPSITATVIDASITYAKIQNVTTARVLGRSTAGSGVMEELSIGTGLDLTAGVLSTTVTQYTDELAQDAVGTILADSSTIDFTYNDGVPSITAAVIPGGVDHDALLNFVGNEHIDHTSVTLTAGTGISGGGDISANRTFDFAPSELSTVTPTTTDLFVLADDSDSGNPKVATLSSIASVINGTIDHGTLTGLSDDDHAQYIYTAPAADTRNVITIANSTTKGLVIKGAASQADNLLEFQNSAGTILTAINQLGGIAITASSTVVPFTLTGTTSNAQLLNVSATTTSNTGNAVNISPIVARRNRIGIYMAPDFQPSASGSYAYGNIIASSVSTVTRNIDEMYSAVYYCQSAASYTGQVTVAGSMIVDASSSYWAGSLPPTTFLGITIADQGLTGVADSYGLKINDQTGSTLLYAIHTGGGLHAYNSNLDTESDMIYKGGSDQYLFFIDAGEDRIGINTNAPAAKIHAIETTQQLRLGYDVSNYMSVTVAATGATTLDSVGSAPQFSFSDKVGVGTSTVSANIHSLATTEQLRLGYDASNYLSVTVGSTGGVTLNATGAGALITVSDKILASDEIEIDGALNHDGTTVGFYGVTPVVRSSTYTVTNLVTDRTYDANATSTAELADVLGTLLADLKLTGIIA